MAGITLRNNLMALNAKRTLGITSSSKAKSAEKLSSGYKINRAADDAAGLAISEKMRKLIRGLNQGTKNAQDGISWVQTGDGALDEAQEIIKRMTELTVKSLNGTCSNSDRAALEAEFEQLKAELDRIGTTTKFNEMNIFSEHKPSWHQCKGVVKWEPDQMHVVTEGQNDLTFRYQETEQSEVQTMTITVPPGEYSTVELLDEIDTAISDSMGESIRVFMEYNKDGLIDATLEGGMMLNSVSGGLSYLMYEMYKGGTSGALIGTTIFSKETARLDIVADKNDAMSFTIEYFDGRTEQRAVKLSAGSYTRSELINLINAQLTGTSVEASAYGTGIKLGSPDAIVTGFKGNMFRIDGADYTSVFYDNVHYGSVSQYNAVFQGGYVLNTDSRDEEHAKITITNANNVLTLQPNRRDTPIDLVLANGEYTMDELAAKLNELFKANNLELNASVISKAASVGDKQVHFRGLEITSQIKGPDSLVNIDPNCSAYKTLFVTRNYNEYGAKAQIQNETVVNKDAWFRGSRDLKVPITLSQGNDTFQITLKSTDDTAAATVTIRLEDRQYASITDLITEINDKIAADNACNGKISAREENGRIRIDGTAGQDMDSIVVKSYNNDNGFDTLFQGYTVNVYETTQSGNGSIVLDGTVSSDSMVVDVDGTKYTVHFPSKNPTQAEIKKAIEDAIKAKDETNPNTFKTVSANGSSSDRNFPASGSGRADVTHWSDSKTGDSKKIEGMVGFEYNYPASMELGPQLKDRMEINSGNNTILLTITEDGKTITKAITIPSGTYNQQTLENVLQKKMDEAFGKDRGIVVTRNGNKLTLTSRLPEGVDGGKTSIACSTADSSFLRWLNTKESPAVCTSKEPLASSIVIGTDKNQFSFQYAANGKTQNISLTLDAGTYTPASIVTQINAQLNKTGTGIWASLSSGGQLVLTSSATGSGVSIDYHTSTAGNAMEALYGSLTGMSPANIVVPCDIQSSINISAGGQEFSIVVNNKKETVTLDAGTYNRSQFLAMLNGKLSAKNVEAYLSGNRLGFRTKDKGPGVSIKMEYAAGGSSMESIYGVTTTTIPGVKAEWIGDSLKLTAVDTKGNEMKDKKVTVSSATSGGLQPPNVVTTKLSTAVSPGYHSRKYSKIDGANLQEPVIIDQWNDKLEFRFTENGVMHHVSIAVDHKNAYTYTELRDELQGKIDAAVGGTGKIEVTVDQGGVVFTAANKSSEYQFSDLSGGFYQNVMCSCTKKSDAQAVNNKDGYQIVNKAYVVGRKDIKSQPIEINKGVSDELSIDVTFDGKVHKVQVTLDPGRYDSESIKRHLQEKIDEKMVQMGMNAGVIEVGVGGISSGVAGGNDQRALNFSLSKDVTAPGEGEYIIDGVSGNAAFELFYQTDGRMIPAYIMGTKDVSKGVVIKPGETELSVCVDGKVYSIELETGPHTAAELIDELNKKLDGVNAPLAANIDFDTGRVKISHKLVDSHDISWVSGSAKDEIFFDEEGNYNNEVRRVQLSDENPDYIKLMRSEFSASHIGINSLCITKIKYAVKAVDQLSGALEKISRLRSIFGSTQNRIEHAVNNNNNKAENLQSAESLIRDADMAEEMVWQAANNILEQSGISMLAQARHSNEMILGLLQ